MLLLQTNPSATFLLAAERQKRPNGDGDFFQWISQMALEQHIENSSFSDVLPGRKRLSWNTWKFHYQVVLLENPFMACMSSFFSKDPETERKFVWKLLKISQKNFGISTIFFVLLKLTYLVTLFDYFWHSLFFFHSKYKRCSLRSQCWMRLFFCDFPTLCLSCNELTFVSLSLGRPWRHILSQFHSDDEKHRANSELHIKKAFACTISVETSSHRSLLYMIDTTMERGRRMKESQGKKPSLTCWAFHTTLLWWSWLLSSYQTTTQRALSWPWSHQSTSPL